MKQISISVFPPMPVTRVDQGLFKGRDSMAQLEEWRSEIETKHSANILAIEHNAEQAKAVASFLISLGITNYTERVSVGRMGNTKLVLHPPGYIEDIRRTFPTYDGYESALRSYTDELRRFEQVKAQKEQESRAAEAKRKKEREEREDLIALGKMSAKHGVECGSWDEMLDALREKCKYVDLGIGLLRTRMDWSEGLGSAECALDRFVAESPEDQAILDELQPMLEVFEDGRCFRDADHGYNYVLSLADAELAADARLALEKASF